MERGSVVDVGREIVVADLAVLALGDIGDAYRLGKAAARTISGLDIALWDLMGKALGQPASRLLGGNYRDRIKPYASILFEAPEVLRDRLEQQLTRGFRAIKMGWRPFGQVSRRYDELLIKTARDTVGDEVEVDAGGSGPYWPHGVAWARDREDARRVRRHLVRGGAQPR
jgi:L-alanine-DL-glutamate epimerase-like enolase superfamily enzyme